MVEAHDGNVAAILKRLTYSELREKSQPRFREAK